MAMQKLGLLVSVRSKWQTSHWQREQPSNGPDRCVLMGVCQAGNQIYTVLQVEKIHGIALKVTLLLYSYISTHRFPLSNQNAWLEFTVV